MARRAESVTFAALRRFTAGRKLLSSEAKAASLHLEEYLLELPRNIHKELKCSNATLYQSSCYLFDGKGKSLRPTMAVLMAGLCNNHISGSSQVQSSQLTVAMIAEMIHTASLIHDDVIDGATTRRGKPSVNAQWGESMSVVTGDFILARSSMALARLNHVEVIKILSAVIDDLVKGEIMQLKSVGKERVDMFSNYLEKTFRKTASLMANSCKAVAILGGGTEEDCEAAYQYGRHFGLAFQLTDDMLDYKTSCQEFGKPTAVDLKLGLATAPVLFAADQFPELNEMINRKFSEEGDTARALELVNKSSGLRRTHQLAEDHTSVAMKSIESFKECKEKSLLFELSQKCTSRTK